MFLSFAILLNSPPREMIIIIAFSLIESLGNSTPVITVEKGSFVELNDKTCGMFIDIDDYEQYIVIDPEFFRPCEVPYLKGSYCKAKDKLGWEPDISFSQLVQRMVENDIQSHSRHVKSSYRA